ncbi:MAG TPA: CHAD domain-containing protein [Acidimicrobiales bacterium]|nr:CHAD domain-containing protein [Acidimicrobiales bacterium]
MPYRVKDDEAVPDAVRRIAHEQLGRALVALDDPADDVLDGVVHDVRKRGKKVRALLRLVRDELDDVYPIENAAVRDAARRLAPARDAAVHVETLALVLSDATAVRRPAFVDLADALRERQGERRTELATGDALAEVAAMLGAVDARVDDWPVATEGWDAVAPGLRRVYERGRDARAAAIDEGTPEAFHDWRKRAKYLRYQLEIVRRAWPAVLPVVVDATHDLTDDLGEAHDLSELHGVVASDGGLPLTDGVRETLMALIEHRRAERRDRALRGGARLYAETPSRFVDRIGAYWAVPGPRAVA